MPNLGFDVQEARLIEWLKQPGDAVQKGEVLAIVESDKANVELESIAGGVLLEQLVRPGVEVPVGAVIARVGLAGAPVVPTVQPDVTHQPSAVSTVTINTPIEVSPVARKLAADHNIDLAGLPGSGPRGRITKEDVEAAIAQTLSQARRPEESKSASSLRALPKVRKAARNAGIKLVDVTASDPTGIITLADIQAHLQLSAAPQDAAIEAQSISKEGGRALALSRIRQTIARRMSESKQNAPHFYVNGEFDVEAALRRLKAMPEPRPGINDLIQYLTIQALRRVPALNATFENNTIYQYDAINLALAVAREDGLITPVLHGAERFSLTGLAQESRQLIARARVNKLQPHDLQGATFTVSNLGVVRQVDQFTAIINPPQVAILAVGAVKQRPVVIDGGLHVRHTVHLSLSGDHRAVDGAHLAQFLSAFQTELDNFSQGQ
jgi:pyruvate dehydrogenase E2 component (dihydrolipoamide acetyltransferase)